jgi:hypothetical protein
MLFHSVIRSCCSIAACLYYFAVKLRGFAKGPLIDSYFFIILDRLYETLDQRMNSWYRQNRKNKGIGLGLFRKKRALHETLVERMTVAYDLAAAFFYLHENRYVS